MQVPELIYLFQGSRMDLIHDERLLRDPCFLGELAMGHLALRDVSDLCMSDRRPECSIAAHS